VKTLIKKIMQTKIFLSRIETKIGSLVAGVTDDAVIFIEFQRGTRVQRKLEQLHENFTIALQMKKRELHHEIQQQVDEYFDGKRLEFDLPMRTVGTKFQNRVWELLMTIPAGQTVSYSDASEFLGHYYSAEDVASAANANHIMLLVPCHRLIGKDGSLVGYSGGIDRKRRLLEHESKISGYARIEMEEITSNVS